MRRRSKNWPRLYTRVYPTGSVKYGADLGGQGGKKRDRRLFETKGERDGFVRQARAACEEQGQVPFFLPHDVQSQAVKLYEYLREHNIRFDDVQCHYTEDVIPYLTTPNVPEIGANLLAKVERKYRHRRRTSWPDKLRSFINEFGRTFGGNWAYLSSGTWSLLGIEVKKPIITDQSREYNFTNEAGYGGSIRFLKNIIGLWILQECRRQWVEEGKKCDYDGLTAMASEAVPLKALINPNDARFGKPDNMPHKIADFCRETGQNPPATDGGYVRCVLESLALLYRKTLEQAEEVADCKLTTLHIVGGGSKNALLNQLSANATGRQVEAGPVEATATGNVLIQAIVLGHLPSLDGLRRVVRESFPVQTYQSQEIAVWQEAYAQFRRITS